MTGQPLAPATCSDAPIWNIFLSAFHTPAMVLADELGLFAALAIAPSTSADLAPRLGIELRAVDALTGTLAALELLVRADGRFHLTDVAHTYLVPGQPYYWGGMLRRIRDNPLDCQKLVGALRRGQAAAEARVTGLWEAPEPPAEAMVAFTHAMHAHSFALAMRVMPRLGLDGSRRLLDVAGGSGSYSIAAVHHHAALACTVLDLPAVCAVTRSYADQYRGGDRIAVAPANMFKDAWPTGHDHALLCDIFHDWDDERCVALAASARDAVGTGGKVTLHEMLLDDTGAGPLAAAAYSMAMIFSTQGCQRTAGELCALLRAAGLVDVTITPTSNGYAAITGVAP